MHKIPTVWMRDFEGNHQVHDEVTPGCEWVLAGDGLPTEKIDGTACLIEDGKLFRRYNAKHGKKPPAGWIPLQDAADPESGHWPGWIEVPPDYPERQFHEAFARPYIGTTRAGTFELIGPKVRGNPYRLDQHVLVLHGTLYRLPCSSMMEPGGGAMLRMFSSIRAVLERYPRIEGIVWHHPDGRMAKIKRRDFGLPWPVRNEQ